MKQKEIIILIGVILVLAIGLGGLSLLGVRELLFPKAYRSIIYHEAQSAHIDPFLLAAVSYTESHFGPMKRGTKGEIGLMQIRPATIFELEREKALSQNQFSKKDLTDPKSNVFIGAAYLQLLQKRLLSITLRKEKIQKWFNGDPTLVVLHSYNAGPTLVLQFLDQATTKKQYEELLLQHRPTTVQYGKNVTSVYKKLKWLNFMLSYEL